MKTRIGPDAPADARPIYWDGHGLAQGNMGHQRMSPAIPQGLVGEHLPRLEDGEVEIVMIGMQTVLGDVISVRALRDGDTIRYRVVDEYEDDPYNTEYVIETQESSQALTFNEVTDLLVSIHVPDYGHLFEMYWAEQQPDDLKDYENDFFELQSDFYDGLQKWLGQQFQDWKGKQIQRETA